MDLSAPILLAEDDDNDVFLFRQALTLAGVDKPLIVAEDGQEVVDYFTLPTPGARVHPAVIVLDLNMPRMDGFEVLAWLSKQPHLRSIPVLVLSSSDDEGDQARARQLGAVAYWVKPFEFDELVRLGRELARRWENPEGSRELPEPPGAPRPPSTREAGHSSGDSG